MTQPDCRTIRMSAMALRDGERATLSPDAIEDHLRRCPECRREVAALDELGRLLDRQCRRAFAEDLRPRVAASLGKTGNADRYVLGLLAILLTACGLVGRVPGLEFSPVLKVLPVVLAAVAFCWLRANPFRINPHLKLEGA